MTHAIIRRGMVLVLAMLMSATVSAQNRNNDDDNNQTSFRGIVVGAADDAKSFTIVDRSGQLVAIPVTSSTMYDLERQQVNYAGAVVYGMEVRGQFAADGSAAQVSARGIADEVEDEQLQAFMAASDAEWSILQPKIQRIQDLQRIVEGRGGGGRNNAAQRNMVQELQRTLQSSFFNLSLTTAQLRTTLNALRQEQSRARAELAQARQELQRLVTTRQEVLLVMMEILE